MEYTNNEKHVLSLMDRTDFKNLSKIDILSYASKLTRRTLKRKSLTGRSLVLQVLF